MKISKEFFQILKKNFLKLFLIKLIWVTISVLLGYISLKIVKRNILRLQEFIPGLNSIQAINEENINQVTNQLNNIGGITQTTLILMILAPVVIFLLYCIFQSIIWSSIKNVKYRIFLMNFIILNLFAVILLIILIALIKNVWILLFVVLILFYLLFLSYATLENHVLKDIKRALILGIRKMYIFLPLIFLFFIFSLFYLIMLIRVGYSSIYIHILEALFYFIVFMLFKIYLILLVRKYE